MFLQASHYLIMTHFDPDMPAPPIPVIKCDASKRQQIQELRRMMRQYAEHDRELMPLLQQQQQAMQPLQQQQQPLDRK